MPRLAGALLALLALIVPPSMVLADGVVGKITQVTGKAEVKRGSASLNAVAPMPIQLQDEVKTLAPGQVTLQMDDNSILTLNESSLLKIDESVISNGTRTSTNVGLLGGSLRSFVTAAARGVGGTNFKVTTPNAIAGVRGTDFICTYNDGHARPGFSQLLSIYRLRDHARHGCGD